MTAQSSLIDDLERALSSGSNAQRFDMLSRVTDLFIGNAQHYSPSQIDLFDEVIAKLAVAIEARARAKLSNRLADIPNAPKGAVRVLAFDDNIEVARAMLSRSEGLAEQDLVANAKSKSQLHLVAIAERKSLSEAVTDVLVTRGDRQVAQTVAKNSGARFSDAGFRMLVQRSVGDEGLALHVGARRDLPRPHFLRLLEQASATVRTRLAAENPAASLAVDGIVSAVVGGIRTETRKVSRRYAAAVTEIEALWKSGTLGESEVYRFTRDGNFENTVVSLSLLSGVEVDVVERALHDLGHEIALILIKLAGFSSTAAKAILLLKTTERAISARDLDQALQSYEKLQLDTARRVLAFYNIRINDRAIAC